MTKISLELLVLYHVIWHTDCVKGVEDLINFWISSLNIFFKGKHMLGA